MKNPEEMELYFKKNYPDFYKTLVEKRNPSIKIEKEIPVRPQKEAQYYEDDLGFF